MSREQWGHGYYQGKKEAFLPEVLRTWVIVYDEDGYIALAGRVVRSFPEDRALLEVWNYVDLLVFNNQGWRPSEKIDDDSLCEVDIPWERSEYFASWDGFIKKVRSENVWRHCR